MYMHLYVYDSLPLSLLSRGLPMIDSVIKTSETPPVYIYIYIYMYTYMSKYICICIYIHKYIHIHVHVYDPLPQC